MSVAGYITLQPDSSNLQLTWLKHSKCRFFGIAMPRVSKQGFLLSTMIDCKSKTKSDREVLVRCTRQNTANKQYRVAKKALGVLNVEKRLFIKEVALLNKIKGHTNLNLKLTYLIIVSFIIFTFYISISCSKSF